MTNNSLLKLLNSNNLLIKNNSYSDYSIVTYNSKEVINNSLFICKGFLFKKEYLLEAKEKGATCYISEVKYDIAMEYIIVNDIRKTMAIIAKEIYKLEKEIYKIGVTGTKGKTTTVYFIHNILDNYYKCKTPYISTIDYYTGKESGGSHNTTPDSFILNKYIKEVEDSKQSHLVMEVSSQAEKLDRIYGLTFEVGAFLNIGLDHISEREHSSFEDYLGCKIKFLKKCKKVYLYKETDYYSKIKEELKDKEVITFGFNDCDYKIRDIKKDNGDTIFKVNDEEYRLHIKGKFNCINACCAIAIAKDMGIDYESIYNGILNTLVKGRMEVIDNFLCPIIIDYAHNKLSIETLIKEVIENYLYKKIVLVGGIPGNNALNRRKDLAELVNKYKCFIYLTTDNPNYEKPKKICKEIAKYLNKNYKIVIDRKKAIEQTLKYSSLNDIVIIFGKGDEHYQFIKNKRVSYDGDKEVVELFLHKKRR